MDAIGVQNYKIVFKFHPLASSQHQQGQHQQKTFIIPVPLYLLSNLSKITPTHEGVSIHTDISNFEITNKCKFDVVCLQSVME
jgi:hypothetical protein